MLLVQVVIEKVVFSPKKVKPSSGDGDSTAEVSGDKTKKKRRNKIGSEIESSGKNEKRPKSSTCTIV